MKDLLLGEPYPLVALVAAHLDGIHDVCDVCADQVVFDDRVDLVGRGPGLYPGVRFRRTRLG
jgi:hypothetical protein